MLAHRVDLVVGEEGLAAADLPAGIAAPLRRGF